MHILFATVDFVENNGPTTGLPKYLYRTAKTLVEWGHEVSVVTCSNRNVEYMFNGINVYRVRRFHIKKYGDRYYDELNERKRDGYIVHEQIKSLIKRVEIDIIQYASISGLAIYHDFDIPAVMRLSSYAKMWPKPGQCIEIIARSFLEVEASKKCNGVFGPSYLVANTFSKDIDRDVTVIETSFVLEIENEDDSLANDLVNEIEYILFYGALIGYKGLSLIAESAYELLDADKNLHIVIIGTGDNSWVDLIKEKSQRYSNRIIYHNAVSFSKLVPLIRKSKLVILPSQMENFSNACVESMALGQIVLGTNGASFEQLIVDGENGFLCEIDDKRSFVDKILFALNLNEEERNIIRINAKKTAERLNPQCVTRELLEYYLKYIV